MGAEALAQVLQPLKSIFPAADHPDLLVGLDRPDDAAVYRMDAETALVVTTDFFPPVVDDAYEFGAIAAANAMSDVFAMGGEVILALNLLALPEDLPAEVATEILRGGAETVRSAGAVVAGGHSVQDREPKYGLAVVGRVHPEHFLAKAGARPGDRLVLTKPLGSGLITTALKQGRVDPAHLREATQTMRRLNLAAGRLALEHGASSATDITGYALVGHALEMLAGCPLDFEIDLRRLPLLPGALDYADAGAVPGGTSRNREAFADRVDRLPPEDSTASALIFDPQTSGGLLITVAEEGLDGLVHALRDAGESPRRIGRVVPGRGRIVLQGELGAPESMGDGASSDDAKPDDAGPDGTAEADST